MDGLSWKTLLKWMIWGYHHLRKHPYGYIIDNILTYQITKKMSMDSSDLPAFPAPPFKKKTGQLQT